VYRTDDEEKAKDVRLMEFVGTEPPGVPDPTQREAEVAWFDTGLIGGRTLYYRIAAVDVAGNDSPPSAAIKTRVVDTTIPDPPILGTAQWVLLVDEGGAEQPWPVNGVIPPDRTPAIRIEWASAVVAASFSLTRRGISAWAAKPVGLAALQQTGTGTFVFYDTDVIPSETYEYAVRVTSSAGLSSAQFSTTQVDLPK
jgi:hypothetical protein